MFGLTKGNSLLSYSINQRGIVEGGAIGIEFILLLVQRTHQCLVGPVAKAAGIGMLSVGELDDLPGTGETVNALLHVEWQSSQFLLGHNMVKGADLLLQLSNDQVVRGKV